MASDGDINVAAKATEDLLAIQIKEHRCLEESGAIFIVGSAERYFLHRSSKDTLLIAVDSNFTRLILGDSWNV